MKKRSVFDYKVNRSPVYDVPGHHLDLWEEQITETVEKVGDAGDKKTAGFSDAFMPEMFHRLYAFAPSVVKDPNDGAMARKVIHDQITDMEEFKNLRRSTIREAAWAAAATTVISEHVAKALPELKEAAADVDKIEQFLKNLDNLQKDHPDNKELQKKIGQVQKQLIKAKQNLQKQAGQIDPNALGQAVRQGMACAEKEIAEAGEAMRAMGYGQGVGGGGFKSPKTAIALAKKIKSSPQLKKIMLIAGRMKAIAKTKRLTRIEHARNENIGVEPTKELARLFPSEMLGFCTEIGQVRLMQRLADGSAQGYSLRGKERVGKGPVILCLDQSGSMSGEPDLWAKGISLAMLDCARVEKRPFGIVLYSGAVRQTFLAPDPERIEPLALLDVLSSFDGGGTEFGPPLNKAMDWVADTAAINKFSKADIIHITDGEASTSGCEKFLVRARELSCQVYGILIGGYGGASLQQWCTEPVTKINDVKNDTAALNTIFDNL